MLQSLFILAGSARKKQFWCSCLWYSWRDQKETFWLNGCTLESRQPQTGVPLILWLRRHLLCSHHRELSGYILFLSHFPFSGSKQQGSVYSAGGKYCSFWKLATPPDKAILDPETIVLHQAEHTLVGYLLSASLCFFGWLSEPTDVRTSKEKKICDANLILLPHFCIKKSKFVLQHINF